MDHLLADPCLTVGILFDTLLRARRIIQAVFFAIFEFVETLQLTHLLLPITKKTFSGGVNAGDLYRQGVVLCSHVATFELLCTFEMVSIMSSVKPASLLTIRHLKNL